MEILKCVRLPLIPAEIIISKIQPSSKYLGILIYSDLIEIHELYKAMAF